MPAEAFLLLAIVSSMSVTVILKIFSNQQGNRYGLILGNYLTCIIIALLSMSDRSAVFAPGRTVLLLGMAGGALFVAGLVSMQSAIPKSGAALTAAFAKLGLIVPLAVSLLLYGERPRPHQALGIGLVFLAIVIIHLLTPDQGAPGLPRVSVLPLIAVLLACGASDAMVKVFEHTGQADQGSVFFFFLFGAAAVITFILLRIERRRTGLPVHPAQLAAGIAVGIPNYYSSALLLRALTKLPAIIVYPCYSTGTILLVLLVGRLFLGERIDRRTALGLLVILAALILLNL